jgi:hypothetical protein
MCRIRVDKQLLAPEEGNFIKKVTLPITENSSANAHEEMSQEKASN